MRGLILSAGHGKRLRPLTWLKPKPMVKLWGKPLARHVYDYLRSYGIREIVLNVHYKPEQIYKHFQDSALFFYESKLSGEEGAIKKLTKIMPSVKDEYLVVANADTITSLDLNDMYRLSNGQSIQAMDDKTYTGIKILSPDYLKGIDKTMGKYYGNFKWKDYGTLKALYDEKFSNLSDL